MNHWLAAHPSLWMLHPPCVIPLGPFILTGFLPWWMSFVDVLSYNLHLIIHVGLVASSRIGCTSSGSEWSSTFIHPRWSQWVRWRASKLPIIVKSLRQAKSLWGCAMWNAWEVRDGRVSHHHHMIYRIYCLYVCDSFSFFIYYPFCLIIVPCYVKIGPLDII